MVLRELHIKKEWDDMLRDTTCKLKVVHFGADWAPQCQQINDVLQELVNHEEYRDVNFFKVAAENFVEVCQKYDVSSVPCVILLKNEKVVDRLVGANVPELLKKIKAQLHGVHLPVPMETEPKEDPNAKLKELVNSAPCMLFMRGTREQPMCGPSKEVVKLLKDHNAEYETFNILEDEEVMQGLREYSKCPTYPQFYVNGALVGDADMLKRLAENDDLAEILPEVEKPDLTKRLKELINKSEVMVFMKGSPDVPRCGFSKTLVSILNDIGIKYESFDILQDEDVRQGLKTYSDWPTYPQVYVKGNLIGGLDIIKEHHKNGELKAVFEEQ